MRHRLTSIPYQYTIFPNKKISPRTDSRKPRFPKAIDRFSENGWKFCFENPKFNSITQLWAYKNHHAWELRRIFEIADRFDNLRIPIASSLRVPGSTPYYGANGIQDYVEGYTHDGEFVLVAEDGANDLKNYPVNLVNGKIWVNNHAHVLQGKENIANNNFLSYSINRANIEVLLVGGGRAKLNSDVLMDIELEIPSLPEQEAIGNFFSTLDSQITLHQRKSIWCLA